MEVQINCHIAIGSDFSWKYITTPIIYNLSEIHEKQCIDLIDVNGRTHQGHVCELVDMNGNILQDQLILPTHIYIGLAQQLREQREGVQKLSVSPLCVSRHYYSNQEELNEKLKFIKTFFSDFGK